MEKNIRARVKHLVQKHGTRDPEKIAKEAGIEVEYKSYSKRTKGYYIKAVRNKYIVVNENLDEDTRQIVLAHELGHAMLHGDQDICFIREHTLFPTGIYENEANKFAAELLIDCGDIQDEILKGMAIDQISNSLGVSRELVEYKLKNRKTI